ncbi:MAG: 4Fe-4S binding protein [Phycisphaerales bacterium]|nr:4Fe-4S binding protein [Phycisphaerales bacterium]
MFNILLARKQQKHRTIPYPKEEPTLPDRFRGRPVLQHSACVQNCASCIDACPTNALNIHDETLHLDMGRCLFCGACEEVCPQKAINFTNDYRLATRQREDLILSREALPLAVALEKRILRLFGRSLRLRQVSAGGCNACEADLNVLSTVVFDIGRFGIQFVASPRHADGIVLTGPLTQNMLTAFMKTYEAIATPKLVIAVGACAISGGPYINHPQTNNGLSGFPNVDLFIPGCPPHPLTILDGFLRLLGQLDTQQNHPSSNNGVDK